MRSLTNFPYIGTSGVPLKLVSKIIIKCGTDLRESHPP